MKLFNTFVYLLLPVLIALGAEGKACEVLNTADANNVSESDLKKLDECMAQESNTEQTLRHFESDLAAMPSRKMLISAQIKTYDEAASLRAEVLKEAKEILKTQTLIPSEAAAALQAHESKMADFVSRTAKLRESWGLRMKFAASSTAWRFIRHLDNPALPAELKESIRTFKKSFPQSYWGEQEDAAAPLIALETMLKQAREAIQIKTHQISGAAFDSVLAQISAKLQPRLIENQAWRYKEAVKERVLPDRILFRSMLYQNQGLVLTPKDQLTDGLKVLRLAKARMPKEFVPHVGAKLDEWITKFEAQFTQVEKLLITERKKVFMTSIDQLLTDDFNQRLVACSSASPLLSSWWADVREALKARRASLDSPEISPAHGRVIYLLAEQSWIEATEVRARCEDRSRQ